MVKLQLPSEGNQSPSTTDLGITVGKTIWPSSVEIDMAEVGDYTLVLVHHRYAALGPTNKKHSLSLAKVCIISEKSKLFREFLLLMVTPVCSP
jgi:hypothetical protein